MGIISKLGALSVSLVFTLGALPAWSDAVSDHWKVSVLVHQTFSYCDGGRGSIQVTGNKLAFYGQGMLYPSWQVALEPDGSFDKAVGRRTYRRIRIKVAPGEGPREITALYESSLCGFKYVAD